MAELHYLHKPCLSDKMDPYKYLHAIIFKNEKTKLIKDESPKTVKYKFRYKSF